MKRIRSITALVSAVAGLALAASGEAKTSSSPSPGIASETGTMKGQSQTSKPAPVREKTAAPGTDQSFLQKAAEMNLYEIELAKVAERASSNPEIRRVSQDIARSHAAANQQLEKLATSKGVTLPSSPNKAQQQKIAALEAKKGEQFDQAFMQDRVQSTQQTISTFERERSRTSDPEIKAWAESMLPRLKNQLATLQSKRPETVGERKQPQKSQQQELGKGSPGQQPQKKSSGSHGSGS